jgi:CUE domain
MSAETASSPPTNTNTLSRPPRGAGSAARRANGSRGPRRGGFGPSRGGGAAHVKSSPSESTDWATAQEDPAEQSKEVSELREKYGSQLGVLQDIFPDWSVEDLLFTLEEVSGDIASATDRIAGGIISILAIGDQC